MSNYSTKPATEHSHQLQFVAKCKPEAVNAIAAFFFFSFTFTRITEEVFWPGSEHWSSFESIFRGNNHKVKTDTHKSEEAETRELGKKLKTEKHSCDGK